MDLSYIQTRKDLADFLNIPLKALTLLLYVKGTDSYYKTFEIPKKNGGVRVINSPNGNLKALQNVLAQKLYEHQKEIWETNNIKPNISHGFEKNKSIITNARIHKNKRVIVNLDLENFFESIHFGRVQGYFEKNKFFKMPKDISIIVAQLTCYNKSLPQGAPSSPIITNLICRTLDFRLLQISKKYKVNYTRYADDLSFSTNDRHFLDNYDSFYETINKTIIRNGFKINPKKTRILLRASKQQVTGLTVNEKVNIDRDFYRTTRAMADCLYKKGEFYINNQVGNMNQLEGRFAFINQIEKYNNLIETTDPFYDKSKKRDFSNLSGKEKQYQKFLFFKYFYNNEKPVIITEGKTDILYLKAALKKLYSEYPNLVEKRGDGTFSFKISFFKKTKRFKYFFNIQENGADTITNFIMFFQDPKNREAKKKYNNYLETFNKISFNGYALNPVILLYDNEISHSDKPISLCIGKCKLNEEKINKLTSYLCVKLIDKSNLYLVTYPLNADNDTCEIEDLLDKDVLNIELDGRKFSRKKNQSEDATFDKTTLSKYVYNNYQSIDFKKFKPVLDAINSLILSYGQKRALDCFE